MILFFCSHAINNTLHDMCVTNQTHKDYLKTIFMKHLKLNLCKFQVILLL